MIPTADEEGGEREPAGATSDASGATRAGVRSLLVLVATVGLIVALAWVVNRHAVQSEFLRDAVVGGGYPALVALSAASGFNLAVPVPIVSFFPFFLEIGLHPATTVLAIAVGMTLGDLLGFLLGAAGRRALEGREVQALQRLVELRDRHPHLPLVVLFFYAAFAPIPNELLVIPLALLGYHGIQVGSIILAGNVIFNSLFALGVVGAFRALA